MMKSTGWIQAVTLVSLVIVGCNDTTGPGGDPISEQQAAELARLMAGSFGDLAEEEVPISPSAASVPRNASRTAADELDIEWQLIRPCEPSGALAIDGHIAAAFDAETKEATVAVEGTLTHADCTYVTDDATFTTTGNPNLEFTGDFHAVAGEPQGEQTITLTGAFAWEDQADRTGVCEVDLTGKLLADGSTRTLDGGFCGHSIELEISETAG